MKLKILAAFMIALAASGCRGGDLTREKAFHDGVKAYTVDSGMLKEYQQYVEADPALKPETKKIRKDTATGLVRLIDEEGNALKKSK